MLICPKVALDYVSVGRFTSANLCYHLHPLVYSPLPPPFHHVSGCHCPDSNDVQHSTSLMAPSTLIEVWARHFFFQIYLIFRFFVLFIGFAA